MLEQQLWAPAVSEDVRVVLNPEPDPHWRDAEAYRVLPRVASARMLLPDGPRAAVVGSLMNYRGLRRRRENLVRAALGTAARVGLPFPLPRLAVQVRAGTTAPGLPLAVLAEALGREALHASIGVRTGANRKATLQLVDADGAPAGYAKFGWNAVADEFVATEARALAALVREPGAGMLAPRVLASLDFHGHPVVVTEPLPGDVRGSYDDPGPPSPAEIYSLCPVHRSGPIHSTGHYRALVARLDGLDDGIMHRELGEAVRALTARTGTLHAPVPVSSRWHGDLTAWNCARDSTGHLWAWDWESSETDAVAGLDALHWDFSDRRLRAHHLADVRLGECVAAAAPHLRAAGTPQSLHPAVGAVYVLTVVERAATLASRNGGWEKVWISQAALLGLVGQALTLMG